MYAILLILTPFIALVIQIIIKVYYKQPYSYITSLKFTSISIILGYFFTNLWIIVLVKMGNATMIYTAPIAGTMFTLFLLFLFFLKSIKKEIDS